MGPTWGPSGADRTQVGPTLAPCTLLSEYLWIQIQEVASNIWSKVYGVAPHITSRHHVRVPLEVELWCCVYNSVCQTLLTVADFQRFVNISSRVWWNVTLRYIPNVSYDITTQHLTTLNSFLHDETYSKICFGIFCMIFKLWSYPGKHKHLQSFHRMNSFIDIIVFYW